MLPIKEYCSQDKGYINSNIVTILIGYLDSSVILQNTSQLAQQFKDCVPHKLITDLRRGN